MYVHANLCIAIIQSPQNQSACEGETVHFVCVVMYPNGSVPGSPLWFNTNGGSVIQPPDVTVTDDSNGRSAPANVTSILTVANASISDNGDGYICGLLGLNPISSNISFLTVHGKQTAILTTELYMYVHTYIYMYALIHVCTIS